MSKPDSSRAPEAGLPLTVRFTTHSPLHVPPTEQAGGITRPALATGHIHVTIRSNPHGLAHAVRCIRLAERLAGCDAAAPFYIFDTTAIARREPLKLKRSASIVNGIEPFAERIRHQRGERRL